MGNDRHLLPLFPLNMVLFPHSRTQLHIFEQRYRAMVNHCIDNGLPFGIVLIRSGQEVGEDLAEPYLVGTSVRIVDVFRYPDGRLDITVIGGARFRIREFNDQDAYLQGVVEFLYEEPEQDEIGIYEIAQEARKTCEQIISSQIEHLDLNFNVIFPEEPEKLSYAIANMLDLSNLQKQVFLEMTDTRLRLLDLNDFLAEIARKAIKPYRQLRSADFKNWVSPN